jgi:hypothetical protein
VVLAQKEEDSFVRQKEYEKKRLDEIVSMLVPSKEAFKEKLLPIVREKVIDLTKKMVPNFDERSLEIEKIIQEETDRMTQVFLENEKLSLEVARALANLERSLQENQAAAEQHVNDMLTKWKQSSEQILKKSPKELSDSFETEVREILDDN